MTTENALRARSEDKCELCSATQGLQAYEVPPIVNHDANNCILVCATCHDQIQNADKMDAHHWRCLNESAWSQVPAVQVMAWRLLKKLSAEAWARDLVDTLYLDEETQAWADSGIEEIPADDDTPAHRDSNGAALAAGDTVTLIKDLNVKGAGFTAKRGTAVRNISLVHDNPAHIEGRVNGQQIVILTEFVKRN